jgi:glycosyltransferase involved in cell wall biosynthesis
MAQHLQRRGYRVHAIGIHEAEPKQALPDPRGYPVTALYPAYPPAPWHPGSWGSRLDVAARRRERSRAKAKRRAVQCLTDLFRNAGPDAVVLVTQVWAMEWVTEADTRGMRVIGMSHESYASSRASHRYGWIKTHYPSTDRWLVLTEEDADAWIGDGMNNVGFIPNALGHLPEVPSPRTGKTVISVGRIEHAKGVDLLLEAWAEVAPRRPDWKLRMYGVGKPDEEAGLKAECTGLGLDGSVEWMGRTDDVPGALADSSVFVQSSRGEGFPLVLMEAMASGVPCVAFDCAPGVREIVRDGEDGLLAPLGDTRALADRLLRITGNPRLRDAMGVRARTNIQRFAEEGIARRWEELFALLER